MTHRDELGVQALTDASEHLKAEILFALLNAGHRALTGPQRIRKIVLGQALVTSGVSDQRAYPAQVAFFHTCNYRSHVRYRFVGCALGASFSVL